MNPLTQFKKMRTLPLLIAPALVALAALTPGSARATPACGFTTVDLLFGQTPPQAAHFPAGSLDLTCNEIGQYRWDLYTVVKGDADLYVTQNTWAPGGETGWHTHPGPSLVTVIEGTLTVYDSANPNCAPTTYTVGESFTDVGCGNVHNVVNETGTEAKVVSVQIVPAGQPRRIDEPAPASCPALTCP